MLYCSVYRGDEIYVRVLGHCYDFQRVQGRTLIEAWSGYSQNLWMFEALQPTTIPHSKLKDILKNSSTVLHKKEWQT